jgi:hypothetical protein
LFSRLKIIAFELKVENFLFHDSICFFLNKWTITLIICKETSLESHPKKMGITIQGLGNVSNFSGLYTPNINIDWTHTYTLIFLLINIIVL